MMSKEQAQIDKKEERETTQAEGSSTAKTVFQCCVSMILRLLVSGGRATYWVFFVDEEGSEEETSGKRNKKKRHEKKLFSKRFIRVSCIFGWFIYVLISRFEGVLFFSLFIAGTLKIFGLTPAPKLPGFSYLSVRNAKQLKDAMSQKGPRIIYCSDVRLTPKQHTIASEAVKALPPWINRFALDCSAKLPSGKTAYQRFNVDPVKTVMIVQSHGKKAKGINEHLLSNPSYFVSKVVADTAYTIKHVYSVETFNEQLGNTRSRSLLVITDGKKLSLYSRSHMDEFSKLMDSNRFYDLTTWVINDGLYELKFDENDAAPQYGSFSIYCLIPEGDERLLGFYNGEPLSKAMVAFMRSCSTVTKANRDFKPIKSWPTITSKPLKQKKQAFEANDEVVDNVNDIDQEEVLEL